MGPNPSQPTRYNVLGVGISRLNLEQARHLLTGIRGMLRCGYVCVTSVHGVVASQDDPGLKAIHNAAWLVTPDGMPLVWLGPRGVSRVYGPDLMFAVCEAGCSSGLRHYFFGGLPGVAEALRTRLRERLPGLVVVGTFTPPCRPLEPSELAILRDDVARTRPDIIWVGLSTPKQERFMAAHWRELDAGVLVGVGAAFDFLSDRVPQAPRWMQRRGLEWLYRTVVEPRRLGPRYLRNNPRFVALLLLQLLGLRRYPLVLPSTGA